MNKKWTWNYDMNYYTFKRKLCLICNLFSRIVHIYFQKPIIHLRFCYLFKTFLLWLNIDNWFSGNQELIWGSIYFKKDYFIYYRTLFMFLLPLFNLWLLLSKDYHGRLEVQMILINFIKEENINIWSDWSITCYNNY